MMKLAAVVLVLGASACSQRVYSPPSQSFGLGPVHAMQQGQQSLDVEVASHAQIFDPSLNTGAARFRRGVGDNTELSAEGTAMVLDTGGPAEERSVYAGRLGFRTSPTPDVAFFGGAGGGYAPISGGFTSLDGGISLGIHNCVLVPVVQASAFVSQPISPRAIDVSVDDIMTTETPSRTVGGVVRGGLRLSLTPSACRRGEEATWIYAGFGSTTVRDHDSTDTLLGAGIGLQVPL